MAKIIKFKTKKENVKKFLNEVIEEVDNLEIDNMIIASKLKDGTVVTGYTKNLDMGEKQELLGHIQADIINEMIRINYIDSE